MYRDRWQVELGFKRLKTSSGINRLPALDPELARTWLLAHLIAAVLSDEIATEIVGFPLGPARPPVGRPEPPGKPAVSLWRAWKFARHILLQAILPRRRPRSSLDHIRHRLVGDRSEESGFSWPRFALMGAPSRLPLRWARLAPLRKMRHHVRKH